MVLGNDHQPLNNSGAQYYTMTYKPTEFYSGSFRRGSGKRSLTSSPSFSKINLVAVKVNDENEYCKSAGDIYSELENCITQKINSESVSETDSQNESRDILSENVVPDTKLVPNRRLKSASYSTVSNSNSVHRSRSRLCALSTAKSVGELSHASTNCSSRVCSATPSWRSRSMSRLSCSSLDKASIIIAANAARLPTKDRKILALMVARHEQHLEQEELKQLARNSWEEDRRYTNKLRNEENESRRRSLHRHNEQDQLIRKLKRSKMEQELQNLLHEKEQAIMFKAEKWQKLAEEQEFLRRQLLERRRQQSRDRKKSQEFQLLQLEKEKEQIKSILGKMKEHSLMKAEHRRQSLHLQRFLDVQIENETNEKMHLLKKAEMDEKFRMQLEQLQIIIEAKETRAKQNYEEIVQKKVQTTHHQMYEREDRFVQLRMMQEMLDREFNEWQEHLVEYRALMNSKANAKIEQQLSARLDDLRKERVAKSMRHDRIMQEIQNEETKKLSHLKRRVQFKEMKSELVARQKEQETNQSRAVAWASAELRDKLSKTLNPETFDQKVHRVEMEARLMRRTPLMQFTD